MQNEVAAAKNQMQADLNAEKEKANKEIADGKKKMQDDWNAEKEKVKQENEKALAEQKAKFD